MKENKEIPYYEIADTVKRSSAIFYYCSNNKTKTTLSFMNYWKQKRDINVEIVATLRDMIGNELVKESLDFVEGDVINYAPTVNDNVIEGSVEIEVFSDSEMYIPYAAIMSLYQSKNSISLTHSYSRTYSDSEVLSGSVITEGDEGCWTIRDSNKIKSFCVIHAGKRGVGSQQITITIRNHLGQIKICQSILSALKSYETVKIYPSDFVKNLVSFLDGKEGSCSIKFILSDSFTRMLVCNETVDSSELQTAHSNFNYAIKNPGKVNAKGVATMLLPSFATGKEKVLLYCDYAADDYEIKLDGKKVFSLSDKNRKLLSIDCKKGQEITISTASGYIPKRFVTGFCSYYKNGRLPLEVSRGVRHKNVPAKRYWWGPVMQNVNFKTRIVLNPYNKYSEISSDTCAIFKLFSQGTKEQMTKEYANFPVNEFMHGVYLNDIFGEGVENFLDGNGGYFSFFSEFTCFDCLVIFERRDGAVAIEHCF